MPYVISEPAAIRGCYETWTDCQEALAGVPGPRRYMRVESSEECEAVLGGGVVLEPGLYTFTDGNGFGGVGVAIIRMADRDGAEPEVVKKIATSSARVLEQLPLELPPTHTVAETMRLRNGLAEMAALYVALQELPRGSISTVVHDYRGVEAFVHTAGKWRPKNPTMRTVVKAAQHLVQEKALRLDFRHQRSHRSDWAGRHDYVYFNRLADSLARQGAGPPD